MAKRAWGALGRPSQKADGRLCHSQPSQCHPQSLWGLKERRDIWLSLQNELGDKAAFIPRGLRGQPLKPEQRRGFDTHFSFNNPCHWTSPGISLFLQSLGLHSPLRTLVPSIQAARVNSLQISAP